jgi:hypothetical protein
MDENDEFAEKMKLAAGEGNDSMLYVSLTYLCDKNLIDFKRSDTNTEETLYAIQPTDAGIDTVEGVENDIQSRKNFSSLFSLTINSRMTVDSLIKSEVGNIVGVGGAISSKVGIKK